MNTVRRSWWKLEAVLAALFAFTAALTILNPEWIEAFGLDPDAGDGSVERAIVVGLGIAAVLAAILSRRHYLARSRGLSGEEGRS
jgi:hypothetical protein